MSSEPYTVDQYGGCPHCGADVLYDVVGPSGVALGRSYADMNDACWMAEELNMAYHAGARSTWTLIFVGKADTSHELTEIRFSLNLPFPDDGSLSVVRACRVADNPEASTFDLLNLHTFAEEVDKLLLSRGWEVRLDS